MSTTMATKPASPLSDSDMYLHVQTKRAGKIKGEVTTQGHTNDIGVRSWTWGVASPTAIGSAAATGRRQYKHLVVVKGIDSASTGLLSALASNDEVNELKLTLRKAGGEALDYYVMTLAQARVVNIDIGVDENGKPSESVGFAYAKIEVEYKRQQGSGQSAGSSLFADEILATA
jgi:type VI secretion system secreted protein Hcp